jgi:hypothetical protein
MIKIRNNEVWRAIIFSIHPLRSEPEFPEIIRFIFCLNLMGSMNHAMKYFLLAGILLLAACKRQDKIIELQYTGADIQKQFDTLYNHQQADSGLYNGFTEQALATCHYVSDTAKTITQDVFSSMYLHFKTGLYDCVTTTTFQFPDGSIEAAGIFNLTPGATIAPDHDFPIIGGSGAYSNISGTYTRVYKNNVYHVVLRYHAL